MGKQIETQALSYSLSEAQNELKNAQAHLKSIDSQIEMQRLAIAAAQTEKQNPAMIRAEIARLEKLLDDTQRRLAIAREKLDDSGKQAFSDSGEKLKLLKAKRVRAEGKIQLARQKLQVAELQREVQKTLRADSELARNVDLLRSLDSGD